MDQEWKEFITAATANLQEHGFHYQRARSDLLEVYNRKVAELADLKQTMSQASQQLLGQASPSEPPPMLTALPTDMRAFHEAAAIATAVELVNMELSDGEDMEDTTEHDETTAPTKGPKVKVGPFRGSASPNRVANLNLKPPSTALKAQKEKEKDKEK